jgi:lipid A 3-O-deacylase
MSRIARAFIALLLVVRATSAAGQDAGIPNASVRLDVDNDVFAPHIGIPSDFDYTQGARLSIRRPVAPARLARVLRAAAHCSDSTSTRQPCVLTGFGIGQEIYTPRHNARSHIPGDRPHAAWLFGAAHIERLGDASLHALELTAGVTGPPALGEELQNGVHRILGNRLIAGWNHQIPARLGLAAAYDATRIVSYGAPALATRFVAASAGATVGNLRREVRAGAFAHYGFGETHSRSADAPLVAKPGRFHLTAGVQQSFVTYDAFVEGIGMAPGAQRLAWVNDVYVGAGLRFGRFAGEYRVVSRGPEYRSATQRHAYGAIALSIVSR